jgi:hypothetical protein
VPDPARRFLCERGCACVLPWSVVFAFRGLSMPIRPSISMKRARATFSLVTSAIVALGLGSEGCSADEAAKTGEACAQSTLIAQCPAGSNPILGASAQQSCAGKGDASLITESGSATGQCQGSGSCQVLCQFASPCTCGVDSVSKEGVICSKCKDQSCGDGRCDGTERATCPTGDKSCVPCAEDCGGATCGDGDCTGSESPTTCPQDCAGTCTPNDPVCVGSKVLLCGANGQPASELADCAALDQVCGNGKCQAKDVCGNGVCDGAETPTSCAQDCNTMCVPSSVTCEGPTQVKSCSADGKSAKIIDCLAGQVCGNGKCGSANVCGNGLCEMGESVDQCPQDCMAATCGNGKCEIGESATVCPEDCGGVCGNQVCEKDELTNCPQDCTSLECTPNTRTCLSLSTLQVCSTTGKLTTVECANSGQVCGNGQCTAANACGNGVCESANQESVDTCAPDCTASCGNGTCDKPFENAQKCSKDCPDDCGDGYCTGLESPNTCALDCPLNCGNGTCDTGESRKNCSQDCGYCGDGACQPEETASLNPPIGKESCANDCLKIFCTSPADCDDTIDCTDDACGSDGKCTYTPNDASCGGGKCLGQAALQIPGTGCCQDADGDGQPAASCGGNDCYDAASDNTTGKYGALAPSQVYQGAVGELCDGIDRNCNGSNKAKVTASNASTLPITTSGSDDKSLLDVTAAYALDGSVSRYLFAWTALTDGGPVVQYALADSDGIIDGTTGIQNLTADPATLAGVVYSPERDQFAIAWTTCTTTRDHGHIAWIPYQGASAGSLVDELDAGELHHECGGSSTPGKAEFGRAKESGGLAKYTLFQMDGGYYNGGCGQLYPDGAGIPVMIGEDLSVTPLSAGAGPFACNGGGSISMHAFVNARTRFLYFFLSNGNLSGQQTSVFSWKPSSSSGTNVNVGTLDQFQPSRYLWSANGQATLFDGTAVVGVIPDPGGEGLRYQRIDPIQFTPFDKPTEDPVRPGQLIKEKMHPVTLAEDPKDTVVALFGTDVGAAASTNVFALLRKQSDGSALTPMGTVATGDDIQSIRALWDGIGFRAFYTSKLNGRHQVFTAPLRCE